MAWDFTADSEKQTEIAKKISDAADKFDEKVDAMYSQIGNMGTYWVGEDYNAYKEGTEGYRNALSDLSDSLRMYSKHFEKVATGTDELSTELISIINDMTGSGAGVAGGNGATGNGVTPGANGGNDALTGSNTNGNVEAPTGNPTGGNVTNNETPGNPSGDKTNNSLVEGDNTPNSENNGTTETYSSGDTINLNGQTYNYYSAYQNPDGSVIHLVADNQGKLYSVDGTGKLETVKASHMNGNGQYVESDATIDSLGSKVQVNARDETTSMTVSLKVGDKIITNSDQLASSVTVSGASAIGATHLGAGSAYIQNSNSIQSDGSLRESYANGVFEGSTVNGSTFVKATSMNDFKSYLKPNDAGVVDVTIQIPQGQNVQWDPSNGWGNGYDFNTSNGPVYLRWDSSANSGNGAYKIVDEYGNYTSSKEYTLDGFNTNYGHWK